VLCQVPAAAGKKKSKKQAEKYDGLESARPAPGRRVSSTRYTTEPRKDDPKSLYAPMAAVPRTHSAAEKNADDLEMPVVAENDYLLPQSGGAAAYVDVVPDNRRGISSSVLLLLVILLLLLLATNSCLYCLLYSLCTTCCIMCLWIRN